MLIKRFNYEISQEDYERMIYLLTVNNISVQEAFRIIDKSLTHNKIVFEKFLLILKKVRGKYFVSGEDDVISKTNYKEYFINEDSEVFFAKLCNGKVLNERERSLIRELRKNCRLNDSVINVLLDYVYKVNNRNMNYRFILSIASFWSNHSISNVEEALKMAKKMYQQKVTGPNWLNDDSSEEASELSQAEMKSLIEEIKNL